MTKTLTVAAVEAAKPGAARREIPDGRLTGLFLVVQPSGKKSWAVRFRARGKPGKVTLGSYPALSLAEARRRAGPIRDQAAQGIDPVTAKREQELAERRDRIEAVIAEFKQRYTGRRRRPIKARTQAGYARILDKVVLPAWNGRAVQSIRRRDVVELLDALRDRGRLVLCQQTLATLSVFFGWCLDRDIVAASPCERVRVMAVPSRERTLSPFELAAIWQAGTSLGYPFGAIVQLLILTGQRRGEVAGLSWPEIDQNKGVWTLPGLRSKNSLPNEVPLCPQALTVLDSLPRIGTTGLLFTMTGEAVVSGWSRAKRQLDKLAGFSDWRLHDLRRTAATLMGEELGVAPHVVEAILNHVSGHKAGVAGVYNKAVYRSEKVGALQRWGAYVESLSDAKLLGAA